MLKWAEENPTEELNERRKKMTLDTIGFTYAAMLAVNGIIDYVKTECVPSLVLGLTSGAFMGIGAYQTTNDPTDIYISLIVTSVLSIIMGYRYFKSRNFIPAGFLSSLSFLMLLRCGYRAVFSDWKAQLVLNFVWNCIFK